MKLKLWIALIAVLFFVGQAIADDDKQCGKPFDQINKKLDDISTQIEEIRQGMGSGAAGSGAKRWVTPSFSILKIGDTVGPPFMSKLNVLNIDPSTLRDFDIIIHGYTFDDTGLVAPYDCKISTHVWGGGSHLYDLNILVDEYCEVPEFWMHKWIEIVADGNIFVDGFMDDYLGGRRPMAWFPVNDSQ